MPKFCKLISEDAGLVLGLEHVTPEEFDKDPALSFFLGSSHVVVCVVWLIKIK